MFFIFKTTLKNLKKNKFTSSILFAFVSSCSTVYLSSENLKDNLDRSLSPFETSRTNKHNFVITSKKDDSLTSSQNTSNIYTDPQVIHNLADISYESRWQTRVAAKSNFEVPWIKKVVKSTSNGTNTYTSTFEKSTSAEFINLPLYRNWHYYKGESCHEDSKNFDKKRIVFLNSNETQLIKYPKMDLNQFEKENALIKTSCDNKNWVFWKINSVAALFWNHYLLAKDGDKSMQNFETQWKVNNEQKWDLSEEEKQDLLNSSYAKKLFVRNADSDKAGNNLTLKYFPLIEHSFFFDFSLPFVNKLKNGKEIQKQWIEMIQNIKNSEKYFNLEPNLRDLIDNFLKNQSLFDDLITPYYWSNFESTYKKDLDLNQLYLPYLPGISYEQQLFMLHKLIFWIANKEKWENPLETRNIYKTIESIKQNDFKKIKDLIKSMKDDKTNHEEADPLKIDNNNEYEAWKKPTTAKKFIFSNILKDEQFSTLKTLYATKNEKWKYNKYENYNTSGGPNVSFQGNQNLDNKKIIEVILEYWEKWLDQKIYTKEELGINEDWTFNTQSSKTLNDNSKIYVPSFKNLEINQSTNISKTFDNKNYSLTLSNFEDAFSKITDHTFNEIDNYLLLISQQKLEKIKLFFNKNNLFQLSFLLHNYKFSEHSDLGPDFQKWINGKEVNKIKIDIHKSAVIPNIGSISAKVNDSKKIGHKFKVVSLNDDKSLNKVQIIEGNPLIKTQNNNIKNIKNFQNYLHDDVDVYKYAPAFNTLARAKWQSKRWNKFFKEWADYFGSKNDETWKEGHYFHWNDIKKYKHIIKQISENFDAFEGSKIWFEFLDLNYIKALRTVEVLMPMQDLVFSGYIEEFSSYFTVVSPEYARNNNITPISNKDYLNFQKIVNDEELTQEDWENYYYKFILDDSNQNSIINVNNKKLIVVGTGLSPDFIFPTHSWQSIIPNRETEGILFVNNFSYDEFANNSLVESFENYISFDIPEAVRNSKYRDEYLNFLNKFLGTYIPSNTYKLVDLQNNSGGQELFEIRSNYSSVFKSKIDLITMVFLFFTGSIVFSFIFFLIKKYIQESIGIFGNFLANGTSKLWIVLSACIYILVPTICGLFLSYSLALLLQPFAFAMIQNYWFIPVRYSTFDFFNFVWFLFKTLFIFSGISAAFCYWFLKPKVSVLLKDDALSQKNKFTYKIYSFFSRLTSIWKFRMIVIFNSLNQTFVLAASSAIVYLLFNFLFHNYGQIEMVSKSELASKNYGFELNYYSPSEQGGQYHLQSYSNIGKTFLNKVPTRHKAFYDKSKVIEFTTDKDNPELIGSMINNVYHPQDFQPFNDCFSELLNKYEKTPEKAFEEFNKKYYKINGTNLYKLFAYKAYDHYLNRSYISEKTGSSTNNDGKCAELSTKYESKFADTETIYSTAQNIWKGSKENNNTHFTPQWPENKKYNFANYFPTVNEKELTNLTTSDIVKYNNKPLFEPLAEKYFENDNYLDINTQKTKTESGKTTKTWYLNNLDYLSDTDTTESVDETPRKYNDFYWWKDGSETYALPTLSRLFKDNSNYLLISLTDLDGLKMNPEFFKNKVITRFLIDFQFSFSIGGVQQNINIWRSISNDLKKLNPELVTIIENNYYKFVEQIINSKYGEFFVNRFMTKHKEISNSITDSQIFENWKNGSEFNGLQTYSVVKSKLDPHNREKIEQGLYYLDFTKVFFFYNKLNNTTSTTSNSDPDSHKQKPQYLIYRPDFLYLFFSLMNDKNFLKKGYIPIKFAANYSLYTPNYEDFYDEYKVDGQYDIDESKSQGIVSQDKGRIDYSLTPNGDQSLTYLNGYLFDKNGKKHFNKISGLKKDKRGSYYKLIKDDKYINEALYNKDERKDFFPVIINHYSAKKFNLDIGSTIEFEPINHFSRYTEAFKEEKKPIKKYRLKVVDIYDSYFQENFFISQKNANKILGLDPIYGHNGILTKNFTNDLPKQFNQVISMYSISGMFNNFKNSSESKHLKNLLKADPFSTNTLTSWQLNSKFLGLNNYEMFKAKNNVKAGDIEEFMHKFNNTFYQTNMLQHSILQTVDNGTIKNDIFFKNIGSIILSFSYVFSSILTPLLIAALSVISYLIVEDFKKLLVILKLLGFTGRENSIPIVLYLLIVLLLTFVVGTALFVFGMNWYINFIFENLKIYLPIEISWKYILTSFGLLSSVFAIVFMKSYLTIKNIYMPIAMKKNVD